MTPQSSRAPRPDPALRTAARPVTRKLQQFFDDIEWLAGAGAPVLDIVTAVNVGARGIRDFYAAYHRPLPDVLRQVAA